MNYKKLCPCDLLKSFSEMFHKELDRVRSTIQKPQYLLIYRRLKLVIIWVDSSEASSVMMSAADKLSLPLARLNLSRKFKLRFTF